MKKFIIVFIFFVISSNSFAENKIVYLDVSLLLNESIVGQNLNKKLKEINNKNITEFKAIETNIKKEDDDLLKKKNILSKEEYEKEIVVLKKKYKSFQNLMKEKNIKLNKLKDESAKLILKNINEIISEYSTKNSISMIVEKKSIIIGKSELNITNDILDLLNKKIKNIELK